MRPAVSIAKLGLRFGRLSLRAGDSALESSCEVLMCAELPEEAMLSLVSADSPP